MRKTVSLQVARDLSVVVRAPLRMPRDAIDRFVLAHEDWINKHTARMTEAARRRQAFRYADGDEAPVGGELLRIVSGADARVADGVLYLPPDDRVAALERLLRADAKRRVHECIDRYAPVLGVRPTGVKITAAKTRWGSCSGKNSLCFSWRTACLPDTLFDYIVVHELAHILQHNHSARFWALVAGVLPDCAQRREQLRRFQEVIAF